MEASSKDTMVENRTKLRQNSHPIIHCPTSEGVSEVSERTSECSGGRERSEQSEASERVSGASKRANGRASGPVLQSVFLAVIDHSAAPFSENATTSFSGLSNPSLVNNDLRQSTSSPSGGASASASVSVKAAVDKWRGLAQACLQLDPRFSFPGMIVGMIMIKVDFGCSGFGNSSYSMWSLMQGFLI